MALALGKWDKGVDFTHMKQSLEIGLRSKAGMLLSVLPNRDDLIGKRFIYDSILYTQLLNGSRIMEAKKILITWLDTGKDKFEITAEKTNVNRPAIVPRLLQQYKTLYNVYRDLLEKANKYILSDYCKRNYGINTHSLRYAFIRYSLEKGADAFTLALIMGHKKIDQTLAYARKIEATKLFELIDS